MLAAFAMFPQFTALDFIGPYQVLSSMPGVEVVVCADAAGTVTDDNGLINLGVEHTFAEVTAPDVLVIPGGPGARDEANTHGPTVDWVNAVHATARWTTSVCTGALILGAAGILKDRPATTHWCFYDELAANGAIPTEQRVVMDGRIATAAGVSAGIDLALALVGALADPITAQAIQLGLEYDPQPPFDSGAPWKATPEVRDLVYGLMTQSSD
ncbi:DJ-1/PfpI family protein [Williamsia maris]|uniref:DJ-1/PfpI family protein n=1 Tax=Williamsia maris TaxID=72806 RepID=A0ABT1HJJ9_9NOCA|nr:DJ-1/PfpI family protein [Williamsia maris]MCP2178102.1 DJ-1/PfpI family protein [Williamsia maris]